MGAGDGVKEGNGFVAANMGRFAMAIQSSCMALCQKQKILFFQQKDTGVTVFTGLFEIRKFEGKGRAYGQNRLELNLKRHGSA